MSPDPLDWLEAEAADRVRLGLDRTIAIRGPSSDGRIVLGGRALLNFGSNDYLGLAADPRLASSAADAALRHGWGAGASPLVSGWTAAHRELAEAIARFEGAEAAALFPTGFAANLGAIPSLVGRGDAVYGDRLNHASIVQGCRLSGASFRLYPHGDAGRLGAILGRDRGRFRRVLIATDGVFSMDGDLAPLPDLAELAGRFDAMLLVDEAHGTGVFGPEGEGACSELGVADRVPIRVGTLSKALGSVGGFVAGSRRLVDHLNNRATSLIYSTAMPAAAAAAAAEALRIVAAEPGRRTHLHDLSRRLRARIGRVGMTVPPGSLGPIVPVLVGTASRALDAASALREAGFFVPAIRPPTVPRGADRLRISVSALHSEGDIDALADALECLPMPGG